jgi:hypothetical protein
MPTPKSLFVAAITAAALMACGESLTVTRINSAEDKPNNVWVFFTVQDGEEPVAGLTAEDFEIYEDEELVSKYESKQTIINPDVAAVMYTLLLLDMSGSVTESGESDRLVDSAQQFSDKVEQSQQKVGVYAFDGGEDIRSVVPFTESTASVEGGLEGLRTYKARDPSTNLNGAVIQGLEVLRKALDEDKRPLKFGTLVVFSDGTDRAARITDEAVQEALAHEDYVDFEIYAIGVGAELEEQELSAIGRNGTEMATDSEKMDEAFTKVAERIDKQSKRFYLLSYCTPSRAGDHTVRIEAIAKNEKGKKSGSGSLEYPFSAQGFGPPPECNPERAPSFRLDKNLSPPPEDDEGRKRTARGSQPGKRKKGSKPADSGSDSLPGGKK